MQGIAVRFHPRCADALENRKKIYTYQKGTIGAPPRETAEGGSTIKANRTDIGIPDKIKVVVENNTRYDV